MKARVLTLACFLIGNDMKVIIGKIISAHGIKGEIKIKSLSDNPFRFRKGKMIYIEKENRYFEIRSSRSLENDLLIIKLIDVEDRNHAEKLKGSNLYIDKKDAGKPGKDSYYIFQLEGMEVFEESGEKLGIIKEVIINNSNDVYCIDCLNGDMLLLPALKQVVIDVDTNGNKMKVRLLPGLKEACIYREN